MLVDISIDCNPISESKVLTWVFWWWWLGRSCRGILGHFPPLDRLRQYLSLRFIDSFALK
jgi:hypothetical protein